MTKDEKDARPVWPHSEITERDFRTIVRIGMVTKVEAKWEFTGVDTADSWLEVTSSNGKTAVLPAAWGAVLEFVGLAHSPGLFELNYLGERCEKSLAAIDAWERKNAADRRAYERLKAKFERQESAPCETDTGR